MHIRTFRAANLNEALGLIRDQMGPEATVLHTRELPAPRLNPFGRKRIEVTAGLKPLRCTAPPAASAASAPSQDDAPPQVELKQEVPPQEEFRQKEFRQEECKREWTRPHLSRASANRPRAAEVRGDALGDELIDMGLPRRIATAWAEQAAAAAVPSLADAATAGGGPQQDDSRAALAEWLARALRIGNPIEPGRGGRRVVALVGPTGVGKTTTIAKLAAGLQLRQQARVGLMTFDTFRAAAVEQLDAFARALDVPLAVVRSTREVAGALERLGDLDLVLIDTVGQGPRGEEKIAAMGRLLAAARPDETHLVVDANGSFGSAADVCAAFKPLQPTAAIISKLDEARRPAPVIAAVHEGALQISYVTDGQRVPEDIAAAERHRLAAAASGFAAGGFAAGGPAAGGPAAGGLVASDLAAVGRGA